jgi:hypothetical protein
MENLDVEHIDLRVAQSQDITEHFPTQGRPQVTAGVGEQRLHLLQEFLIRHDWPYSCLVWHAALLPLLSNFTSSATHSPQEERVIKTGLAAGSRA